MSESATSEARARILSRLRAAPPSVAPDRPGWQPPRFGDQRLAKFRAMLESWRAEVHDTTAAGWPETLAEILGAKLAGKNSRTVVYAPDTATGKTLADAWAGRADAPALVPYTEPVESFKSVLVQQADVGITGTVAGIAETGTVVLWPGADEPRLMSLLPPVHVAVVAASSVRDTMADVVAEQGWKDRMPTNVVLVSGPSKTADIEQTLAFGVHGPKELVVLVLADA